MSWIWSSWDMEIPVFPDPERRYSQSVARRWGWWNHQPVFKSAPGHWTLCFLGLFGFHGCMDDLNIANNKENMSIFGKPKRIHTISQIYPSEISSLQCFWASAGAEEKYRSPWGTNIAPAILRAIFGFFEHGGGEYHWNSWKPEDDDFQHGNLPLDSWQVPGFSI